MAKRGRPRKKEKLVHLQGWVNKPIREFVKARHLITKKSIGKIMEEAFLLLQKDGLSDTGNPEPEEVL